MVDEPQTAAEKIRAKINNDRLMGRSADYLAGASATIAIVEATPDPLLEQMAEALREIRDADQTDMALDPEWPARIARAALSAYEARKP